MSNSNYSHSPEFLEQKFVFFFWYSWVSLVFLHDIDRTFIQKWNWRSST